MKLISCGMAIFAALAVTGCVSAINATNAQQHAVAANEAVAAGDWTTARRHWAKALVNAQLAGASAQQLAALNYEYGRALGVQCFCDESEKHLLKALELDRKTGAPEFMSLAELSRLKYDQKQYSRAIDYYQLSIQAMEKAEAPTKAPAGFADILEEYAQAVRNIGKESEAKAIKNRADKLRKANPEGYSITERTPYGTQCAIKGDGQ